MSQSTEILVKNALSSALSFSNSESIHLSNHLKNDLQMDSMSSLMFLMKLEETIDGFLVDPETLEMKDLETVHTIIDYIDLQLASKHVH